MTRQRRSARVRARVGLGRDLLWLAAGAALVGGAYGIVRVRAEGAPTAQPLWYAGSIATDQGAALTGAHKITLRLYTTKDGADAAVCTATAPSVMFSNGRFRMDASSCADAMKQRPDLFVEVGLDDDPKAFPRTKVGAVPYALEAQHAVTATSASSAAGGLSAQLVPAGMIAMFATACPAGWTEHVAMRGRFPRGEQAGSPMDAAGSDDAVVVSHLHGVGTLDVPAGGSHTHQVPSKWYGTNGSHSHGGSNGSLAEASTPNNGDSSPFTSTFASTHDHTIAGSTAQTGESGVGRNVPRYQEVVFCIKQ